ncbi:hypothetical protein GQ43DRAFT_218951 [Delitschia confertaspora ATCC 74209]|uniref:Uncharacterized protein n=1 Tax=Delitschia confertaspora ATCC 74209 TaxID=1513339 RepID=A0A9P4JD19_9PLEO|nr:hypothetical protein GQ43DRAFT_218951 [Delitschia confertaspora ATCC 74209]
MHVRQTFTIWFPAPMLTTSFCTIHQATEIESRETDVRELYLEIGSLSHVSALSEKALENSCIDVIIFRVCLFPSGSHFFLSPSSTENIELPWSSWLEVFRWYTEMWLCVAQCYIVAPEKMTWRCVTWSQSCRGLRIAGDKLSVTVEPIQF